MSKERLIKIKDMVREVLSQDKKARSSDKWLILQVLKKMGFKIYVDYDDLKEMPSFESITRPRRYWQNTKREFPPTEKIDVGRTKNEEEYKEVFSRE